MTGQGQPETLHRRGDDEACKRTQTTPRRPAAPEDPPVRSITHGKAEEASLPPASQGCDSREGEPNRAEPPNHANRCLVVGNDGVPLMPCTIQRAAKLRRNGRARLHAPDPYCIRILDRKAECTESRQATESKSADATASPKDAPPCSLRRERYGSDDATGRHARQTERPQSGGSQEGPRTHVKSRTKLDHHPEKSTNTGRRTPPVLRPSLTKSATAPHRLATCKPTTITAGGS